MTITTPTATTTSDASGDERTTARRIELGALIAFVLLRVAVIASSATPAITPDEPGTWAVARWLTGGDPAILMRDMPRYPLAAGGAVAPWMMVPVDPITRYRLGIAGLSALTVVAALAVRSLMRHLDLGGPLVPSVGFAAVLLLPATFATGSFTWAEPTIVLCMVVIVWAVVRTAEQLTWAVTMTGSVAAGLAPSVHGRLLAVPILWLAFLVWQVGRRRTAQSLLVGAVASGATVAVAAASMLLSRAAVDAAWGQPTETAQVGLFGNLVDPGFWPVLLSVAAGQAWYLLASTAGLSLAGAAVLGRLAVRPRVPGDRVVGVTVGALLGSVVAVSVLNTAAAQFARDTKLDTLSALRPDHLVYGRYIDVVALLLAVLGVAGLSTVTGRHLAPRLTAAAVIAIGICAVPAWRRIPEATATTLELTVAGAAALLRPGEGLPLAWWSIIAALLAGVVALASRLGPRPLALAVCALLLVGSLRAAEIAADTHRQFGLDGLLAEIGTAPSAANAALVPRDAELDGSMRLNLFPLQAVLAQRGWRFEFQDDSSPSVAADPPPDASLLILTDAAGRPSGDWTEVGVVGDVAVWERR